MSGMLLASGFGGSTKAVKAQDVGGITVQAYLTDGRDSEQTTATLTIINGPARDLTVEARIYYRFGTGAYYRKNSSTKQAQSHSRTIATKHTPATVDMCYGKYKVTNSTETWQPTKTIGAKVSGVTYVLIS